MIHFKFIEEVKNKISNLFWYDYRHYLNSKEQKIRLLQKNRITGDIREKDTFSGKETIIL